MSFLLAFTLVNATNAQLPLSQEALDDLEATVSTPVLPYRANTLRFEAPPGEYIILPRTKSDEDLSFLLRVFSEMPINVRSIDRP